MEDPFDILGLPPSFDLDPDAVERAYLARAAVAHPDASRGDDDAPRRAAALNGARAVLADPERRADALLARLGGPSREQEKSLSPGFLAEMLEVREQIEEALPGPAGARAPWARWAHERRGAHIRSVSRRFASLPSPPAATDLKAIRVELNEWRYVERLIEQLAGSERA